MSATGSHLKIVKMGESVQGVALEGNRARPEFDEFRVTFPGGHVSITRCTDNSYWAHIAVDHPQHPALCPGEFAPAKLVEARLDSLNKHSAEMNIGDFGDDGLYHLAVRIQKL